MFIVFDICVTYHIYTFPAQNYATNVNIIWITV